MELTIIAILSALLPIFTITGFIVGYNVNAPRKIAARTRKIEPTKDEKTLEWLDSATVYTAVENEED